MCIKNNQLFGINATMIFIMMIFVLSACETDKADEGGNLLPMIYIIGPSSEPSFTTNSGSLTLNGAIANVDVVSGISWKNETTGAEKEIGVNENWSASDIPLVVGDNRIKVTARGANGNAVVNVIAVYTPYINFLSYVTVSETEVFTDEEVGIRVGLTIEPNNNLDNSAVELVAVDSVTLQEISVLGRLVDDGSPEFGDDIPNDWNFNTIFLNPATTPGYIYYRVKVTSNDSGTQHTSYSEIVRLGVLERLADTKLAAMQSVANQVKSQYDAGSEVNSIVSWLQNQGIIQFTAVSESGHGIWWVYDNGLLGGIMLNNEGTKGKYESHDMPGMAKSNPERQPFVPRFKTTTFFKTMSGNSPLSSSGKDNHHAIKNFDALYVGPYLYDFSNGDDYHGAWQRVINSECPKLQTIEHKNASHGAGKTGPEVWKTLSKFGVVIVSSHGDNWYNGLWSLWNDVWGNPSYPPNLQMNWWQALFSQPVVLTDMPYSNTYEKDLLSHRIALLPDNEMVITPEFIKHYGKDFPNSIIYMSSCRSAYNASLAAAFFANGAQSYLGYDDYVMVSYANSIGDTFFDKLINEKKNTGESFHAAIAAHGSNDGFGADTILFGSRQAKIGELPDDSDCDGVLNDEDNCPDTPTSENADPCGCSPSQGGGHDRDCDGVPDTSNDPNEPGSSRSTSDPHLFTFDGFYFANQFIGEFILSREKGAPGLEIQARQQRIPEWSPCVTINTAVAMRVASNVVEYRNDNDEVLVDGVVSDIGEGKILILSGGGQISRKQGLLVDDGQGSTIWVQNFGSYLDVNITAASALHGNMEGLLGNFDADAYNELELRNGLQAGSLSEFMANWRLQNSESLFTYPPDHTTESYSGIQDCNIHLSSDDIEAVRQLCIEQFGEEVCTDAIVLAMATDLKAGMSQDDVAKWVSNTQMNEKPAISIWHEDLDGDEYGNPDISLYAEMQPVGYVPNNGDCDDTNAAIHPNILEILADKVDNNCNGLIDEKWGPDILFENFDNYMSASAVAGQGEWGGRYGSGVTVSNEQSVSPNQSCRMDNQNSCWRSELYHEIPFAPIVWFSADIMGIYTGRTGCHSEDASIALWNPNIGSWGTPIAFIMLQNGWGDGPPGITIGVGEYQGEYVVLDELGTYEQLVERWINVMAKVDYTTMRADFWIDGLHVATQELASNAPQYTEVNLSCGEGLGYIDNVRVFLNGPEPEE